MDLRYAVRTLRGSPGFTIAAIFALALGIGANTAIFSAINAVLLNSLPLRTLREPDRLVMIWEKNPALTFFLSQRIGRNLRANQLEYEIVGVLPPRFELPGMWEGFDQKKPEMWVPLNIPPGDPRERQREYFVFGRLARGITLESARAEMNVIGKRLERANPDLNTGMGVNVFPLAVEDVNPGLRRMLFVLQIAVVFVLLIACANVANLLLTRAVAREREIAVRVALGAGRMRIIRQMLSESLLLSALGGAAGLLLAYWGLHVVSAFAPNDTHGFHELRVDPLVLGFTLLVTVIAGTVFGLAPAFHALGQSVNQVLSRGARSAGGPSNRLRGALAVTEIALSLILLIGAGLMIRGLVSLMSTDPGFRAGHLLTMRIALPAAKYSRPEQFAAFSDRLLESVRNLPGVRSAGLATAVPMQTIMQTSYRLEGVPSTRGRTFTRQDAEASRPGVAIVNRAFAEQNWPRQNAIGKVILVPTREERFAARSSGSWETSISSNRMPRAGPSSTFRNGGFPP